MIVIVLYIAAAAVGLSQLLAIWRLITGPGVGDRILALDTMSINAVALLVLFGIAGETNMSFEAALLIATLGFVSTVAYARFVLRRDVIE